MPRVVARRSPRGQWRFSVGPDRPDDGHDIGFDEYAAESRMNGIVSASVAGIGHRLWQLEYAKHVGVHLTGAIAGAIELRTRMEAAPPGAVLSVRTRKPAALIHAVRVLAAGGRGVTAAGLAAGVRMAAATPLALIMVALGVLRHGSRRAPDIGSGPVIALHGEASNRTRHLLPPVFDPGPAPAICIIGRPQGPLAAIAKVLDPEDRLPGKRLFHPFDTAALLRALPTALSLLAAGVGIAAKAPVRLPFRECMSIAYRMALGAVSAQWWHTRGLRPAAALFGHTGVADTTQLEWAMQQSGTRTVHCVHGGSLGWNFAGYSTVGLFLNGHDAALARRFPGYGETGFLAKEKPAFADGDPGRWLLLTAYAHTMNPAYAYAGVEPDITALKRIGALARAADPAPRDLVWRPHPAIRRLPDAEQARLEQVAREEGFGPWPDGLPYEAMAGFGRIFSTPSTAALDALVLGKAAQLVVAAPMVTETVYGVWPDAGCTAPDATVFEAIWTAVEPGRFAAALADVVART